MPFIQKRFIEHLAADYSLSKESANYAGCNTMCRLCSIREYGRRGRKGWNGQVSSERLSKLVLIVLIAGKIRKKVLAERGDAEHF